MNQRNAQTLKGETLSDSEKQRRLAVVKCFHAEHQLTASEYTSRVTQLGEMTEYELNEYRKGVATCRYRDVNAMPGLRP